MTVSELHKVASPRPPSAAYQQLVDMIGFRWKWSALTQVARLRIADLLADGPLTVEQIARRTGTHAPALGLVLQFLSYSGIFAETAPGTFAQTELSSFLRADVPGSVYHLLLMQGSAWHTQAWDALGYSLETGQVAFEHVHGAPIWQYLGAHASEKAIFDGAMDDVSKVFNQQLATAYDFSTADTVVDVAGGRGSLLLTLLRTYPQLRGILFDLPTTAEAARAQLQEQQLDTRCAVEAGDFFESVPAGADVYLLKQILHDWNDAQALTILQRCRAAMRADSTLLIAEMFPRPVAPTPPPAGYPPFVGFLQLQMLVLFGGRERSEAQFAALLEQADLQLIQIHRTQSPYQVLECRPLAA